MTAAARLAWAFLKGVGQLLAMGIVGAAGVLLVGLCVMAPVAFGQWVGGDAGATLGLLVVACAVFLPIMANL